MKLLLRLSAVSAGLAVVAVVWVMGTRADLIQLSETTLDGLAHLSVINAERPAYSDPLAAAAEGEVSRGLIDAVAAARAKAELIQPSEALLDDAENFKRYDRFQADYAAAVLALAAAADRVPALKASKKFRDLKSDVEAFEAKAEQARSDYNALALQYNESLEGLAGKLVARRENLRPRPYLTEKTPAGE